MQLFPTLLVNITLFALLIVPGYIMGKRGLIASAALNSMTNILMYVAMPALVLVKLLSTDIFALSLTDIIVCALFPFLALAVGLAFGVLLLRRGTEGRRRAGRYCVIFSNCGFLGIPLCDALFPDTPAVVLGISLFNVVSTFLLLTVGVYLLSGDRAHIKIKNALLSPVAIAIVLGVVLSLTSSVWEPFHTVMPKIEEYATYLSALTTPLSMLVLGVELSSVRFGLMFRNTGLYVGALIRLILVPFTIMLALALLRACGVCVGTEFCQGLFFATAVSTAASSPAMAQKYGADSEHAAVLTLGTTLLCVVTLPLLYVAVSALGLL